ncbi:amidohydrolase family protein, partial [Microbacterium sp.]|uniref:amidohydrolase family protein n=1 Tax=Microbacterium sp. TaxID=51671 RepID=UPI002E2EB641
MSTTLITNIGELTTNVAGDGDPCGTLRDAAVLIDGSRIAWVGPATEAPPFRETAPGDRDSGVTPQSRGAVAVSREVEGAEGAVEVVDAAGRAVIPGFVDSHTHLVFGGDRADEFEAR